MRSIEFCLVPHLPAILLGIALLITCPALAQSNVVANQNHTPAGELHNSVLTIHLEIAKGEWRPEAEDGMSISVFSFREAGHPLQNPGPLIRVPRATEIQASLHNSLSIPVDVHGLGASPDALLQVAPQATEQVKFVASVAGLFFYWGATEGESLIQRHGVDAELTGVLAVDPPNSDRNDEIFVIEMISDRAGPGSRQTVATIN